MGQFTHSSNYHTGEAVELGEWRSYYKNNVVDKMEFYEDVKRVNVDPIISFN